MLIEIDESAFRANDRIAEQTRARLAEAGVLCVNLLSAPGSGKTSLLEATVDSLSGRARCAVIEGDVATTNDAERLRSHGVTALQINTGELSAACHLDARMVAQAVDRLSLAEIDILFIENVGNLVCPAAFDLGETLKAAVVSLTEGEDKPLKYPRLFRECRVALINKVDLAPYLACDADLLERNLRAIQPELEIIRTSATSGEGVEEWSQWLLDEASRA